ncbi:hypothetical protein WR25_06279 [Diploscapter pachys]|uniref:Uncharacterized protein n=1 Tax=Diploscapter pachys TaxID=2018661 RepID=A0A2A2M5D6_9BILA|nr:hypothetical protein WR25_06279 [Diploscapter pachys]
MTSGTQPPSITRRMFAPKKMRSRHRNGSTAAKAHTRSVVTTIVPVTAMPYAAAIAEDVLNWMISTSTPIISSQLIAGT